MQIPLNTTYSLNVPMHNASGIRVTADVLPKFYVFNGATDLPVYSGALAERTNFPGTYRANLPVSGSFGFAVDTWYHVMISGQVENRTAFYNYLNFKTIPASLNPNKGYYPADVIKISGADVTASGVTALMPGNIIRVTGQPLGLFNSNIVQVSGNIANTAMWDVNITRISGLPVQQAAIKADIIRFSGQPIGAFAANLVQVTGNIYSNTTTLGADILKYSGSPLGFLPVDVVRITGANPVTSILRADIVSVTGAPIVIISAIDANVVQTTGVAYANLYFCETRIERDTTNSIDEYTGTWYRNGIMISSGQISSPTIQVVRRSNGTNLIGAAGASGMSYVSTSLGVVKYDEKTNLITVGDPYVVVLSASIDGATRTWPKIIGRDG